MSRQQNSMSTKFGVSIFCATLQIEYNAKDHSTSLQTKTDEPTTHKNKISFLQTSANILSYLMLMTTKRETIIFLNYSHITNESHLLSSVHVISIRILEFML